MDYEKLKRAHELVSGLDGYYLIHQIGSVKYRDERSFSLCSYDLEKDAQYFITVGDLLEALEEMKKTNPKFSVGDRVWYVISQKDRITIVNDLVINVEYQPKRLEEKGYFFIHAGGQYIHEDFAFKTEKDLIDYHRNFWNNQQGELNV